MSRWNLFANLTSIKLKQFYGSYYAYVLQVLCKRDSAQEAEIQRWIESVLGEKFPAGKTFEDSLKDGIILCNLMNKLSPGIISKINTSGPSFKMMENVNKFHEALIKYGVSKVDIFQTNDLSEKKDIANVVNTLCALGRAVSFIITFITLWIFVIMLLIIFAGEQIWLDWPYFERRINNEYLTIR